MSFFDRDKLADRLPVTLIPPDNGTSRRTAGWTSAYSRKAVALDPYGVGAIVDTLYEVGIYGQNTIVGISQGWKLSGVIKTAERKLADRTLMHGGQALMAWAVSSARVSVTPQHLVAQGIVNRTCPCRGLSYIPPENFT